MIHIELDAIKMQSLERAAGLKQGLLVTLRKVEPNDPVRGTAVRQGNHVTIHYGLESQAVDRLVHVQAQIVRTLLHEVRHVWQGENWTDGEWEESDRKGYWHSDHEKDAREWADLNLRHWRGLVKVRRSRSSRLGKLSATEERVR